MKTFFATAMIIALGISGIFLWGTVHAQRMPVLSSQIFIHGTPVCVMQHAGEILASVGMCGTAGGEAREDDSGSGGVFHGEAPSPLGPRFGLPPGHPPVDSDPSLEKGRKVLI